jgi:UDP-N-acetylmuramyl pentapeptide synthase
VVLGDELNQNEYAEVDCAAIKDAILDASISLVMSAGPPICYDLFNGISWECFNTIDAVFTQLRFELKSGDWVFIKTNHTNMINRFISQLHP